MTINAFVREGVVPVSLLVHLFLYGTLFRDCHFSFVFAASLLLQGSHYLGNFTLPTQFSLWEGKAPSGWAVPAGHSKITNGTSSPFPSWDVKIRRSYPCNKPWMPRGLWDIEATTFFRQSAKNDGKVVSITRRPPFTPQEYPWYSFLIEAKSTLGP
jgi:hypothetical protein